MNPMIGLAALAFAYLLSQFYRTAIAVIARMVAADLNLDQAQLGALSSAWFIAFAAMQIPVGVLLDRYGPQAHGERADGHRCCRRHRFRDGNDRDCRHRRPGADRHRLFADLHGLAACGQSLVCPRAVCLAVVSGACLRHRRRVAERTAIRAIGRVDRLAIRLPDHRGRHAGIAACRPVLLPRSPRRCHRSCRRKLMAQCVRRRRRRASHPRPLADPAPELRWLRLADHRSRTCGPVRICRTSSACPSAMPATGSSPSLSPWPPERCSTAAWRSAGSAASSCSSSAAGERPPGWPCLRCGRDNSLLVTGSRICADRILRRHLCPADGAGQALPARPSGRPRSRQPEFCQLRRHRHHPGGHRRQLPNPAWMRARSLPFRTAPLFALMAALLAVSTAIHALSRDD